MEVARALAALGGEAHRIRATAWPADLAGLDKPGLYSWWVDAGGAGQLAQGLGMGLAAGLIYAGQTGATKWPSGRTGSMTLRNRLRGNHLRGNITSSTFRRTLAACLREPLGLEVTGPNKLAPASEQALSQWMRERLSVAVHPLGDRDVLGDLEKRVLHALDPPLNLAGPKRTDIRRRLTALRGALSSPAPSPGEAASTFLDVPPASWVASNAHAFAIRDRFPVSPGHSLVISRRPIATWFDASREEKHAVIELVDEVKALLDDELGPDGYNVGFNAGAAAGQTVMHLHVHVIPRFTGDTVDPRGGIRHVFPDKANYLSE